MYRLQERVDEKKEGIMPRCLGCLRIPAVGCSSENSPERKHTKTAPITKRQAVYCTGK